MEAGADRRRVGGVADRGVEIDDAVERAAGADEAIDRLARRLAFRRPVEGASIRQDGGADHADAAGMGASDDLPVGENDVVRL